MRITEIQNRQRFQFTVDGYGYHEEEDHPIDEDDPIKKWHYMTTPDGERITLDHSPYQWMEQHEFAEYVAKHKEGLREESTDIQYPDYDDHETSDAFYAGWEAGYDEASYEASGSPVGQSEPGGAHHAYIEYKKGLLF